MPLRAECDYCHAQGAMKLRPYPGTDRFVLPDGWASTPLTMPQAIQLHEPVEALVACSEKCLVRLHEIKERAVGGDAARRGTTKR